MGGARAEAVVGSPTQRADDEPDESLQALAGAGLRAARNLVAASFELFALELRAAGLALAGMLTLAIGAALLGVTIWLLIQMALVQVLVLYAGVGSVTALLAVAGINLVLAAGLVMMMTRAGRHLEFRATRTALGLVSRDSQ